MTITCPGEACPFCTREACRSCGDRPTEPCGHGSVERHSGRPPIGQFEPKIVDDEIAIARTGTPTVPLATALAAPLTIEIQTSNPAALAADLQAAAKIVLVTGRLKITIE